MPSEVDIRPMVETNSAVPMVQLRVARSLDELRLSNADRGIIFVFAAWSGPTVMAFQRFTRVMKSMDTRSLDVVVLDTDCLTQDSAAQLFGAERFTTGGWGEVVWIRGGRVIAREVAGEGSDELLERHTKELLDDHVI